MPHNRCVAALFEFSMISTSNFDFSTADLHRSDEFTDRQTVASSGYCLLTKAMRNGKWSMLKSLKQEYSHQQVYQEALRKEYDILASLQHPNVVAVSGFEEVEGLGDCIVMEYVHGHNLRDALKDGLSQEQKLGILRELLDALDYIHKKQIVHRDIKPSNVMVGEDGCHVKLIDFGLSDSDVYTLLKQPSGTDSYMSPEQKTTPVPDSRNDLYSVGCLIEAMDMGKQYRNIIDCCRKPIDKRYQTVSELRSDVERASSPSGLRRGIWLVVAAILLTVGIAIAVTRGHVEKEFCVDGLYYRVLADVDTAVELIRKDSLTPYTGDITVPSHVQHDGVRYTVVSVGDRAFGRCPGIIAVVLPQTIRRLGNDVFFYADSLATLNLPDSITEIGDSLFRNCRYLRSVHLPRSMTEVPPYCFSGCHNLRYVNLHEGITVLRRDAFGASEIDSIQLPRSLRAIDRGVFWACLHLKTIRIPSSVERIGDFVFWYCDSLTDVYVERSEPLLITNIFQNLQGVRLHVPKGSREAYQRADGWKVLDIVEE